MMAKRYDVCSPRPRKDSDKPYWHRVGTAWEGEKGINITFDSLPLPDKAGRVAVALFEPREKQDSKSQTSVQRPQRAEEDSEIPF
jgi:hypothetical protein